MSGGDRRGSSGYRPLTGRTAGFCAGFSAPGFADATPGRGCRGFGFGTGSGRGGRGGGFPGGYPPGGGMPGGWNSDGNFAPSREEELKFLSNKLRAHEEMIGELKKVSPNSRERRNHKEGTRRSPR